MTPRGYHNMQVNNNFYHKGKMANLITGTKFEQHLWTNSEKMTDFHFRKLIFAYCQLYQEIYWFDQLENAFTHLELAASGGDSGPTELYSIRSEVEEAMGEYFESLNEVATTIYRLLNDAPLSPDDTLLCIAHIWNAHACNEDPAEFRQREDQILCKLLSNLFDTH